MYSLNINNVFPSVVIISSTDPNKQKVQRLFPLILSQASILSVPEKIVSIRRDRMYKG